MSDYEKKLAFSGIVLIICGPWISIWTLGICQSLSFINMGYIVSSMYFTFFKQYFEESITKMLN